MGNRTKQLEEYLGQTEEMSRRERRGSRNRSIAGSVIMKEHEAAILALSCWAVTGWRIRRGTGAMAG